VIVALPDESQARACVAYAIPRAVGPAVDRNRLRRRLRAITRVLDLEPGSYLFSAAPPAASLTFDELAGHVRRACGR